LLALQSRAPAYARQQGVSSLPSKPHRALGPGTRPLLLAGIIDDGLGGRSGTQQLRLDSFALGLASGSSSLSFEGEIHGLVLNAAAQDLEVVSEVELVPPLRHVPYYGSGSTGSARPFHPPRGHAARRRGGRLRSVPLVSVVIVTHNSREDVARCLASLPSAAEAIIVDNASTDDTPDEVRRLRPDAIVIQNRSNRGFGAACNQGLEAASGDLALLLNPDAEARRGAIEALAEALNTDSDAVAAGGSLRFPDGRLQDSVAGKLTLWALFCEQTGLERILHAYWQTPRLLAMGPGPHEVEQVMGACMMLKRNSDGRFPRFDERFFLYCEDTELCHRLRAAGGKILFVTAAEFVHALGTSSKAARWRAVAFYNRGKELYFAIHHGAIAGGVAFVLNRLGALLRLALWSVLCVLMPWRLMKSAAKVLLFARVLAAPLDPYARWVRRQPCE